MLTSHQISTAYRIVSRCVSYQPQCTAQRFRFDSNGVQSISHSSPPVFFSFRSRLALSAESETLSFLERLSSQFSLALSSLSLSFSLFSLSRSPTHHHTLPHTFSPVACTHHPSTRHFSICFVCRSAFLSSAESVRAGNCVLRRFEFVVCVCRPKLEVRNSHSNSNENRSINQSIDRSSPPTPAPSLLSLFSFCLILVLSLFSLSL